MKDRPDKVLQCLRSAAQGAEGLAWWKEGVN